MEQEKIQSIIESVLFVSGEPVKKSKLEKLFAGEIKSEELETALEALATRYAEKHSGLMLLKKGDEVQIVSNPENAQYIEKIIKNELQDSLSTAAAEVVSIVAYRGPISKTEIEAIRGVNCAYTLRNLLLRGLIERNDNARGSRGYVYSISFDFLKKMGIDDVKKMPQYDILSVDERINSIIES